MQYIYNQHVAIVLYFSWINVEELEIGMISDRKIKFQTPLLSASALYYARYAISAAFCKRFRHFTLLGSIKF
jgi:hypothetical protein